jgi:hypothetical protein
MDTRHQKTASLVQKYPNKRASQLHEFVPSHKDLTRTRPSPKTTAGQQLLPITMSTSEVERHQQGQDLSSQVLLPNKRICNPIEFTIC